MAREKFDWRRDTITINVTHEYWAGGTRKFCISYSRLPSGKVGEVWVNAVNELEKTINDDVRDTCIALSRALQYGDTLEHIAKSIQRDARGKPQGYMGTIVDVLKKEPVDA